MMRCPPELLGWWVHRHNGLRHNRYSGQIPNNPRGNQNDVN